MEGREDGKLRGLNYKLYRSFEHQHLRTFFIFLTKFNGFLTPFWYISSTFLLLSVSLFLFLLIFLDIALVS